MKINLDKLKRIWNILLDKEELEEKAPVISLGVSEFMCKACELGKVVTNECNQKNYSLSAAKLQKLLVLMHGEHLAKFNKPIFPENVLCWKCGVAIKEVELKFLLHDFSEKDRIPVNIAILQTEDAVIHSVLDKYGSYDVVELNKDLRLQELTSQFPYVDGQKVIIPNDAIKKVFNDYGE